MEKVAEYKKTVRLVVEEIAQMIPFEDGVETQLITDDEHGHYLLSSVGWFDGRKRELTNFVHLDVKPNGKIWVQHDGTDLRIALILVEKGVPKHDIVLGFHAPFRRELMPEFAMA